MAAGIARTARIESLDQFRGYTVLGMFLVNFVGSYAAITSLAPVLKHHHTYCSYADTIMPQFFFAVGFAYRLTMRRRLQTEGRWTAYGKAVRRNLGLILLGVVVYHLDGKVESWAKLQELGLSGFFQTAFKRNVFQTLVHIGVTGLWVLPVITAGPLVRIAFACFSAGLHVYLSYAFNYEWVLTEPRGIDGGPLGFLTWTVPMLVGSLAYDAYAARPDRPPVNWFLFGGVVLMLLGYGLSCLNGITPPNDASGADARSLLVEPPFVPPTAKVNYWTMSQRAGSVSYLVFGAGFSLAVYALFVWVCDRQGGLRLGLFRTLGTNALAAYLIHDPVMDTVKPYTPRDAPLWYVLAAFGVFLGITYLFVRYLEKHRIYLRL